MENNERIIIDTDKLDISFKDIENIEFNDIEKEIIERAKSYKEDSKYYLEKEDMMTSFGCITYSHGLIDALKIIHELI
ncbi:MAG: DUF357 domain-containing protein [Methanobrevibacter sp.]|jgi:hypothetical protein|nr:DUF357 domain-containing protein [Candidatus Methanovirga basalitermitum]